MHETPTDETVQSKAFPSLLRHEILLLLLGGYTLIALVIRVGIVHTVTLQTTFVICLYLVAIGYCRMQPREIWQKLRLLAGYLFVLWYFLAVAVFVPTLDLPTRDTELLRIDESQLGQTPAVALDLWTSPLLTEIMSACYLSYLVYLHVAIIHAAFMPTAFTRRFANWLLSVYAIGLPFYLLVPAKGPARAFPELFVTTLDGGPLTSLNQFVVEKGSSVYDVFPSLHVMITCALMEFDRRNCPKRFRLMLLPAAGLFASTLYLRYHYAIDLLAGAALFLFARAMFLGKRSTDVATGS